MSQENNAFKFF